MFRIAKDLLYGQSTSCSLTPKSFENPAHNQTFSKDRLLTDIQKLYPSVIFIAYRSKNENVVVYELIRKPDKSYDIDVYWLELDNMYRKVRRDAGIMHDRVELSMMDSKFAYGVTTTKITDDTLLMRWNGGYLLKQLLPFTIVIDTKNHTGRAVIDGHKYIRSVFIHANENVKLSNLLDNLMSLHANYIDLNTGTPHTVNVLEYLNIKK
jgi:hypothetical protein